MPQFIPKFNFKANHMLASVNNDEELKAIHRLRNVGKTFGSRGFVQFNTVFARGANEGNFLRGLANYDWKIVGNEANKRSVVIPNTTCVTTRARLNAHDVVEYERVSRTNAVQLFAEVEGRGPHATYHICHLESA
ncbi:hypothetical protein [Chromobacterium haemolyticum]|uniref:hypothetical protein n=1 Tax=Chromobacterium haemolyticum TaxID=394935 RepID=UPI0017463327|nr:hypothetical protein [Chromobacterium haemolyticum]QOD81634.1 hypothetical protein IEZ30_17245 [Chromobacterium haemolyticum]